MIRAGAEARAGLLASLDRPLLHDLSGESRTGRQLVENVDRLAGLLLAEAGIGAKIGLWYRNSPAAVEAFLAVEWIGGTRVPVDPGAPAAEARAIFEAAGVALILADGAHAAIDGARVIAHEDDEPAGATAIWPEARVEPDRTLLLYPRAVNAGRLFAVPVSYGNWRATMRLNIELYRGGTFGPWLGAEECFLAAQQIMHGTGFVGTFPFLEMGLPQVLVGNFDARQVLEAVARYRVTTTVLVPPMLTRLVDAAADYPGSSGTLRHVTYGGGGVRPDEIRRAMRVLGPVLSQGYGRIEGGWPIAVLGPEAHVAIAAGDDRLAASCGQPVAGNEIRLRPAPGAGGKEGELMVRSPLVVAEYADPEGWCSLGDLMRQDVDSYLYFRGRLDRMVNTGYHVYPDEIEAVIAAVPGVAAVRVGGEPDPEWGERLVADLVLAPGAGEAETIGRSRQAIAARLAKYKMPRLFRCVDRLPAP